MKITKQQFESAMTIVNKYKKQLIEEVKSVDNISFEYTRNTSICDLYNKGIISARLYHYLHYNAVYLGLSNTNNVPWRAGDGDFTTITLNDLNNVSLRKLKRCKNIGKTSIKELIDVCALVKVTMLD